MFTLYWDLFSLVFFSFSISSDLQPGRITLTCLKAIFNLTLSFSSSPMNVNHRANTQGQLMQPMLCRAKINLLVSLGFRFSLFPLKVIFWYNNCSDAKVATAVAVALNLFCRSLSLTFTPSWVPIWRSVFHTLQLRLGLRCLSSDEHDSRHYVK